MLQFVEGKFWVNNHAHVLQGRNVSTNYVYLLLKNMTILDIVTGSAQPKISQGRMSSKKIIIPDKNIREEFCKIIDPFIDEIFIVKKNNESLIKIRDMFLPRLMSGKLSVENKNIV